MQYRLLHWLVAIVQSRFVISRPSRVLTKLVIFRTQQPCPKHVVTRHWAPQRPHTPRADSPIDMADDKYHSEEEEEDDVDEESDEDDEPAAKKKAAAPKKKAAAVTKKAYVQSHCRADCLFDSAVAARRTPPRSARRTPTSPRLLSRHTW